MENQQTFTNSYAMDSYNKAVADRLQQIYDASASARLMESQRQQQYQMVKLYRSDPEAWAALDDNRILVDYLTQKNNRRPANKQRSRKDILSESFKIRDRQFHRVENKYFRNIKAWQEWQTKHWNDISTYGQSYDHIVADLKAQNMQSTLSEARTTFRILNQYGLTGHTGNINRDSNTQDVYDPAAQETFYSQNGVRFFDDVTGANGSNTTTVQAEDASIGYQKTIYRQQETTADLYAGWKHIQDTGVAGAYDLETLGSADKYGRQVLDRITEFSFLGKKKDSKTGKFVDDPTHSFGTVFGITSEDEFNEYMRIIDKLEHGSKEPITDRDRVIFGRLKLAGSQKSVFGVMRQDGVVRYESFAGKEDVVGEQFDTAREGAKRLYWLGQEQAKRKVVYKGHEMLGVEAEFFKFLDYVHDNDITLISHNGTTFDNRMSSMFLAGEPNRSGEYRPNASLVTEGAREYAKDKYAGGVHPKHQFDSIMAEITFDPHHKWTKEEVALAAKQGLTSKQLEFLQRINDPDFYERQGAAHLAAVDIQADLEYTLNSDRFGFQKTKKGEKSRRIIPDDFKPGETFELHGGNTQLLYMTKSINVDDYNLYGFVKDAFTGTYRTTDKHNVGKSGYEKDLFPQWPLQGGVAYTVDSVKKVTPNEITRMGFSGMSQRLNGREMYLVGFKSHVKPGYESYKTQSISYLYGTYDDVQHVLQEATYYTNELVPGINGTAHWENRLTDKQLEELSVVHVRDQRVARDETLKNAYSSILEESSNTILNESAARVRRGLEYKKDKRLLHFMDDMDTYAVEQVQKNQLDATEENLSNFRHEFIQNVRQKSAEIEKRIQGGEQFSFGSNDLEGSFHKYFGFAERGGGVRVYRETVDSAINSIGYMHQIRGLVSRALESAERRGGDDAFLKQQYYQEYMNVLIDRATTKGGTESVGAVETGTRAFKLNKYTIDMSGYREGKRKPIDIVKSGGLKQFDTPRFAVSLDGSGIGLADRLIRFQSEGKKDLSRVTDAQKMQALNDFKDYLVSTAAQNRLSFRNSADMRRFKLKHFDIEHDTLETASQFIMDRLRYSKERDKNAGLIDDTIRYDLLFFRRAEDAKHKGQDTVQKVYNFGLTDQEIEESFKTADQRIPTMTKYGAELETDANGNVIYDSKGHAKVNEEAAKKKAAELRQHARRIVDEVIFSDGTDEEILKRLQQDNGYTDEEIEYFREKRRVEKENLTDIMEQYINGLRGVGASIEYDTNNKTLSVIDANGKTTLIDNLVHAGYKDGISYFEVGKQQIVDQLGFYEIGYGRKKDLAYGSRFMKAASDTGYRMSILRTAAKENSDIGAAVKRTIGDINNTFSEVTAAGHHDAQDVRAMALFDNRDMFRYMKKMYKAGYLQDIKPVYKKDLITGKDLLDENGEKILDVNDPKTVLYNYLNEEETEYNPLIAEEFEKIMYYNQTAAALNYDYLKKETARYIKSTHNALDAADRREIPQAILDMLHFEWTKNTKGGRSSAVQNADFGEAQTMGGRGEFEQMGHFMKFDSTNFMRLAGESDKSPYEYLKDVSVGQAIQSRTHDRNTSNREGLLHDVDTTANAQKLDITTADLHTYVNDAIRAGRIDKNGHLANFLSLASTGEASAIISIDVADEAFSRRSTEQSFRADNEMFVDPDSGQFFDIEDVWNRNRADFKIMRNSDNIEFHYGTGFGVQRGETFGATYGYQGAKNFIQAKEAGIARFGFYTHSGMLVDEETINHILNKANNKAALMKAQTEEDVRRIFYEILGRKEYGFTKEMHVHSFMLSGNDKLVEQNAEKGMHRFLGLALGESNQKVKAIIDVLGGKEGAKYDRSGLKVKDFGAIFLEHEFVRGDILKSMLKRPEHLAETAFGIMLNTYRDENDQLTSKQMAAVIRSQYGGTTEEAVRAFYGDIMAERNSLKHELNEKVLRPIGVVRGNESVSVISETYEAEKKHQNVNTRVSRIVNQARRAFQDLSDSEKKALGDIDQRIYKSLSKGIEELSYENGKFIVNNPNGRINEGILRNETSILSRDLGHSMYTNIKTGREYTADEVIPLLKRARAAKEKLWEQGRTALTVEEAEAITKADQIQVGSAFGVGRSVYMDVRTKDHLYDQNQYESIQRRAASGDKRAADLLHHLDERYSEVVYTSLGQEPNVDNNRYSTDTGKYGKRIKMTHRNIDYLSGLTYTDDTLKEIRGKIQEAVEGGYMTKDVAERQLKLFEGRKDGELVYGSLIKEMLGMAYQNPSEVAIAKFDSEGNQVALTKQELAAAKRERKQLHEDGLGDEEIDRIIDSAKNAKSSPERITASYVRKMSMSSSYSLAGKFNLNPSEEGIDTLKKAGFKVMNIDDIINLGSGIDMKQNGRNWYEAISNSLNGQRIILDLNSKKLGNKKLYASESERYMALPFTAPALMQNGEIVQAPFQKTLAKAFGKLDTYYSDTGTMDDQTQDERLSDISQQFQAAKEEQIRLVSQKHKIIASSSEVFFNRGIFATTARTQISGHELAGIFSRLEFNGMKLKDTARMAKEKKLMDLQYGIASTSKMNLLYDQAYFKKLGFEGTALEEAQKKTKEYLKTKGTIMVHSRDPQGYLTSTNTAALYFDDSVKGDTLLASEALQEAKKNDNDSDKTPLGIVEGEADITVNGQTRHEKIDYATYNALKDMQGVSIKLADTTENLFRDTKAAILNQSLRINPRYMAMDHVATENEYYVNKDGSLNLNRIKKYTDIRQFSGGAFDFEIDKSKMVDGGLGMDTGDHRLSYSIGSINYTPEEKQRLGASYDRLVSEYLQDGINEKAKAFNGSLTAEQLQAEQNKFVRDFQGSKLADQRSALSRFLLNNKNYSQDQIDEYTKALEFNLNESKVEDRIAKDLKKNGAGIMNYDIFNYLQISLNSHVYTGAEGENFIQVSTAIYEDFLSPKNTEGAGDLGYQQKIHNAMQDVLKSAATNDAEAIHTAHEKFYNTLLDVGAQNSKWMKKLSNLPEDEGEREQFVKKVLWDYSGLAERVDLSNFSGKAFRVGQANEGIVTNSLDYLKDSNDSIQAWMEQVNRYTKDLTGEDVFTEYEGAKIRDTWKQAQQTAASGTLSQDAGAYKQALVDHGTAPAESTVQKHAEASGAMSAVHGMMASLDRIGGIKGMIAGMAGGILLAGYGSSPATPASTQAAGAQEEEQEYYGGGDQMTVNGVPRLSDSNLNVMRGGPQKGYVINISAQSQRGQQQAINAINGAVQSGTIPTRNSVNIQMNTSYSDKMNQLQVNQMVANSLLG